jgi:acetyl-CoA carboxylase carboxyl transferase subunit beta
MSWIDRVRKALPFAAKRETPDNLWHKCPSCGTMLFTREYEENQSVCTKCQHHGRIGAAARFDAIFDSGVYTPIATPQVREDPLKFRDSKKYADRIKAARAKTGEQDALINASGRIEGFKAIVGVQDFGFLTGTMGLAVGAAFVAGVQAAIAEHCPYIIFTSGGGARMQEGIMSLMQMPKTTIAVQQLHEAGLPYIVVLTDPTTGGITASYAMLGDVQIAEPGALIGFAGQRVIENTVREKLPEGFQRAEYLLDHGMLDMVVHRHKLRSELARLIAYLCPGKQAA